MSRFYLFSISLLFLSPKVWALIDFEDAVYPELATSGRALAMGNAYIAKADDSSAAFYNPAGLGTVRGWKFHVSNFHLETNKDLLSMGGGGKISDVGSNVGKSFSLDGTRELLLENPDKISHSRFHILPNLTTRFFSLGYLLSKRTKATISSVSNAPFEYADRLDHGPYLGINLSLFGGVIKVGATGLLLKRKEGIGEAASNQTFELTDDLLKKGHMFHVTTGVKLTLPVSFLPTLASTIHNSTAADFTHDGGVAAPDTIKQTVDFGFSISPKFASNSGAHFEFNYKDAGKKYSEVSSSRRSLFGIELDFSKTMFVRFGYGDGFGSFGLGLKSKKVELDITTYAVDTTAGEFRGREDRRFSFTLSSGL